MKAIVAIDLGASSGRVAAGWLTDGTLKYEIIHRFPNKIIDSGDELFWDFENLLVEVERGLRKAGDQFEIESIGVDSWAVDYGLLQHGKIVGPINHYRSSRTNGVMDRVMVGAAKHETYRKTGLQFLPFNTLYQLIAHAEHRTRELLAAELMLMIPDLVYHHLCGSTTTERTNASTTQLYNSVTESWDNQLVLKYLKNPNVLAEIKDSGTILGQISGPFCRWKGLQNAVLTLVATHDTASAVAAIPMDEPETSAFVSSGTWSLVGLELPRPLITDLALQANFSNEAGINGSTRFLKNVMGLWILQECARAWGNIDWEALVVSSEPHTGATPVFDPDDPEFMAINDQMHELVASKTGIDASDQAKITAAILKSLAIKTSEVVKQAAQLANRDLERIYVVGGGCQNDVLNQLIADASGLEVIAGPVEATLMGNLLIQAEALRQLRGKSIRQVVKDSSKLKTFLPRLL